MAPETPAPPRLKPLLDEMWPPFAAQALRRRGHDVAAVAERSDLRRQPDPVIIEKALFEGRAVVTADVSDYRRMAAQAAELGRLFPALILTSPEAWLLGRARAGGRLVNALDALLASGAEVEGELWLAPID